MRIIALGTGRPFVRRAQANCSWLIELGNGDKFIMDFGSGSQANFTALEIPHQDITAYFATHLHADHVGDFAQVWIGSWTGGRVKPLVLYGPSGPEPKYGIAHFVRRQMESLRVGHGHAPRASSPTPARRWKSTSSITSRRAWSTTATASSSKAFPRFTSTTVRSAIGSNGTASPSCSQAIPRRASSLSTMRKGADLLIHECFNTVTQLIERSGYDEKTARARRHHGAYRAGRSGTGACSGQAAACRRLPLLQRLRHRRGDRTRDPQALPWPARAGAGSHGVQRHAG